MTFTDTMLNGMYTLAFSSTQTATTAAALSVAAITIGTYINTKSTAAYDCIENPVETMTRIKVSFPVDSNTGVINAMEGSEQWEIIGDQIVEEHNEGSEDCVKTYQRKMMNCSYKYHEIYNVGGEFLVDTYWDSFIRCNNLCPILDPLFGVDVLDPITSLLHGFDPVLSQKKELTKQNPLNKTETADDAIESTNPLASGISIPINRTSFLQRIGATFIDPSPRKKPLSDLPSIFFRLHYM